MKNLPFAIITGNEDPSQVVLSSILTVHSGNVAQVNAQIAEVNANFANYGFVASPGLPTLPTIPTPGGLALPNGIAYFTSWQSFLLVDANYSQGYSMPSAALDTLLTDVNLVAIKQAAINLRAAITVQPTAQTIAHNAAGAIALTATGTTLTYQWQIQLPGASSWANIVNGTGPFTTATTASLTITTPVLATYNGATFRCQVQSAGAGVVQSNAVILTVT